MANFVSEGVVSRVLAEQSPLDGPGPKAPLPSFHSVFGDVCLADDSGDKDLGRMKVVGSQDTGNQSTGASNDHAKLIQLHERSTQKCSENFKCQICPFTDNGIPIPPLTTHL